jgi:hypothetical protein
MKWLIPRLPRRTRWWWLMTADRCESKLVNCLSSAGSDIAGQQFFPFAQE